MTKSRNIGRGGVRPGAGRKPSLAPAATSVDPESVNPRAILAAIASDRTASAAARVAAAKALMRSDRQAAESSAEGDAPVDPLSRRALELLAKGNRDA